MFETPITVVGRIITDLRRRVVGAEEVISFRVASNSRRRTAEGEWEQGNSLFVTVNCWGRLVTGVGAGLYKGAPVIVVGNGYTSEYVDKDGIRRSTLEIRAMSVGPDLARSIARIEQQPRPRVSDSDAVEVAEVHAVEPDSVDDDGSLDGADGLLGVALPV